MSAQEIYHRVQIALEGKTGFHLQRIGLEIDHGQWYGHSYLETDLQESEIDRLRAAGFKYRVMIDDVSSYYRRQEAAEQWRNDDCENSELLDLVTPSNFSLGTMGGYYSYDEMLAALDLMHELYPKLVSPREEISGILTHEGRPIYGVKFSDNVMIDEDEPEVLFTSIHHAREPLSMSQLIFQMWYLLENYLSNPRIGYLVDETEMYFIPCVNPDGYIYNYELNPDGGALWRKNRRDNGSDVYGVDLNRNYGYEWGFDDNGSSPNPRSQTYRGPAPFSEPETQAIREYVNSREFVIALNNHSFGNLLIYPYGYSDTPTPDQPSFSAMSRSMTRLNNFVYGTGTETVGYTVNGDSDDWMYGEEQEKAKIFAMTPESGPGSFGFWPPMTEIDRLCKESLELNLTTAELALDYTHVSAQNDPFVATLRTAFQYRLERAGLQASEYTIRLESLDPLVSTPAEARSYSLDHLDIITDSLWMDLDASMVAGQEFSVALHQTSQGYTKTDTFTFIYGQRILETVFADTLTTDDQWIDPASTSPWSLTESDFISAPSSMTESPDGNYMDNQYSQLELADQIVLPETDEITLRFWSRWEIEPSYDYCLLEVTTDGGQSWEALCGRYTRLGSSDQREGIPLWDGVQDTWVQESIDLSSYSGQEISLRFTFASDGFVTGDGFYFDDFEITYVSDVLSSTTEMSDRLEFRIFPNPVTSQFTLQSSASFDLVEIYDTQGKLVYRQQYDAPLTQVSMSTPQYFSATVYTIILKDGDRQLSSQQLVLSH